MGKPMIYIASPYTIGDPVANTERAMRVWHDLWSMGFVPICPLWSHFQQLLTPLQHGEWLEYDLHILAKCDAVLRLDGESVGVDRFEVPFANEHCIPVFYSTEDLLIAYGMER